MSKRSSDNDLRRRLAAGSNPEPPADLASRIKSEIPAELSPMVLPGPGRLLPASFRLLAASLLLGVGVGWVTATLVTPPENLARDIALDGVLAIPYEPVELLVPPRWQAERRPHELPLDARRSCLNAQVRTWQFPAAAGISILRLTLFVDPGERIHRTSIEGAMDRQAAEVVIGEGLGNAVACLHAQAGTRLTLFVEIVVGSEGQVVWVETTSPW